MKILYHILYTIFILFLISILNIQCVFPNFALCFCEDGHVDIDIAFAGNEYTTMHHIKEHHKALSCSTNYIFLSEKSINHCYDELISLSSNFLGYKSEKKIDVNTIINPQFTIGLETQLWF